MSLIILVEHTEETLFENGHSEGIRQDYDTIRRVGQGSHLKEANLIETTTEKVDSMTIVGCSNGQTFVELKYSIRESKHQR